LVISNKDRSRFDGKAIICTDDTEDSDRMTWTPTKSSKQILGLNDEKPDLIIYADNIDDAISELTDRYDVNADRPEIDSAIEIKFDVYTSSLILVVNKEPITSNRDISEDCLLSLALEFGRIRTTFNTYEIIKAYHDQDSKLIYKEEYIISPYSIVYNKKKAVRINSSRKSGEIKRIKNGSIKRNDLQRMSSSIYTKMKELEFCTNLIDFYMLRPSVHTWEGITIGFIDLYTRVFDEKKLAKLPSVRKFVENHISYANGMIRSGGYRNTLGRWIKKMKRKYYTKKRRKKAKK